MFFCCSRTTSAEQCCTGGSGPLSHAGVTLLTESALNTYSAPCPQRIQTDCLPTRMSPLYTSTLTGSCGALSAPGANWKTSVSYPIMSSKIFLMFIYSPSWLCFLRLCQRHLINLPRVFLTHSMEAHKRSQDVACRFALVYIKTRAFAHCEHNIAPQILVLLRLFCTQSAVRVIQQGITYTTTTTSSTHAFPPLVIGEYLLVYDNN